jgi:hypothetical protein
MEIKRAKTMKMLPAKPGVCSVCATDHKPEEMHNYWSLHYQVHFKMRYGRDATHADACAHTDEEVRQCYREVIDDDKRFTWSEPDDGVDTIAEPYASHDH